MSLSLLTLLHPASNDFFHLLDFDVLERGSV